MSTTKRVSGSYTIQSIGANDTINLNSAAVIINGNLYVTGNSQQIVTTDTAISDNKITLNHGLGLTASPNPAGATIEVDRGAQPNVSIIWSETLTQWQVTRDGVNFSNIGSGNGNGVGMGNLNAVSEDYNPSLGGNLNITGYTIYDSSKQIVIQANTVGSGGSGVYVTNSVNPQGIELSTTTRSTIYSLIFS